MRPWQSSLIGVVALLLVLQGTGLSDGVNRFLTDAHWRWAARYVARYPGDLLIVAVDDASLLQYGRLRYWSRRRYADLLHRLREARAVGLDLLFTEPDTRDPEGDAALAAAIHRHGRVVLPLHRWREARPYSSKTADMEQRLLERLPTGSGPGLEALAPSALEPPLPGLLAAAAAVGTAEVDPDPDGVFREPMLLRRTGDRLLPHFSLALAGVALGQSVRRYARGGDTLTLGTRTVTTAGGRLLLQPLARQPGGKSGPGVPIPTLGFALAMRSHPSLFRGKILLVGETATGTPDIRPTPLDAGLRGVELNAEILANLLSLPPVRPLPDRATWLLIGLVTVTPLVLFQRMTARAALRLSLATALLALVGMEAAFWMGRLVPAWTPVLAAASGAVLSMGLQRMAQEERQKGVLRRNFALYVAP